ncbi:MAG: acetyl-CoA carboxylase [Lactobacillus sp.]|jgi:hypothetical protein|nr:acetyl-CoA carboxylase [Lactobacillus sp.]MCI2033574.1 acetyl-CoA carboxylase [Lactobacillus sp.]
MPDELNLILSRIAPLFTRQRNTRYWLLVANDHYQKTYNLFFNWQPRGHRLHSVPLHTLTTYDLAALEALLHALSQRLHFTITYTGFANQRWPSTGHRIEAKPRRAEQ